MSPTKERKERIKKTKKKWEKETHRRTGVFIWTKRKKKEGNANGKRVERSICKNARTGIKWRERERKKETKRRKESTRIRDDKSACHAIAA